MRRQGLRPCTCCKPEQQQPPKQKLASCGMAGWVRLRGTLQVPLRGPAQPLAAVRSGACEALLRKRPALTHVSSVAACSCALSCAPGKTGVGCPAQPARGMPRAHAAHAPATGPTPPLTDSRELPAPCVEPSHARLKSHRYRNVRFQWTLIHARRGSTRSRKSVRGGAVSQCGASAAWMRLPSLQGRTCGVPALRHRPANPRNAALAVAVAGQRPALPRVQGRRPCRTTLTPRRARPAVAPAWYPAAARRSSSRSG